MARQSRVKMYENWGQLKPGTPKEWTSAYPNPTSAQERYEFEQALIRREAADAQTRAVWANYDFRLVSAGQTKIVPGSALEPENLMRLHHKINLADGKRKFQGKTRAEAKDEMRLASMIGMEYPGDLIQATQANSSPLQVAKETYQQVMADISFKDIYTLLDEKDKSLKESEAKRLAKDIESVSRALQKIVDLAAKIPEEMAGKKRVHNSLAVGTIIDKSAYTAAKNLLEYVESLDELSKKLDNNQLNKRNVKKDKYGNYAIDVKKYSRSGETFKQEVVKRNLEGLSRSIAGSLSNLMGGVFEITLEEAIKKDLGDIFSSVQNLGPTSSTGSQRHYSGRKITTKTSKRDIAAYNKILDVEIGFSAKNQKAGASETKILDTNAKFVRDIISVNAQHSLLLELAFSNDKMWGSTAQMNSSIASLMADVALAGLKGDRVDYMVYLNDIIPIEEYYLTHIDKFIFSGAKKRGQAGRTSKVSAANIISNGNSSLVFRVKK